MAHRNHLLCCTNRINLAHAAKTKESTTSQKIGSFGTFGELLIVFSTKENLLYLLYPTARRCCPLQSDEANLFAKNFYKNSNLDHFGIFLLVFPLELI